MAPVTSDFGRLIMPYVRKCLHTSSLFALLVLFSKALHHTFLCSNYIECYIVFDRDI